MSKVRINDLARELEVKSKAILDVLREVGVTDAKTHSSSLEADEAQRVRAHFQRGSSRNGGSAAAKSENAAQKIDWSRVSKPGDVLKAIQQRKEEAERPAPRPQAAPPAAARPAAPPAPPATPVQSRSAGAAPHRRAATAPGAPYCGRTAAASPGDRCEAARRPRRRPSSCDGRSACCAGITAPDSCFAASGQSGRGAYSRCGASAACSSRTSAAPGCSGGHRSACTAPGCPGNRSAGDVSGNGPTHQARDHAADRPTAGLQCPSASSGASAGCQRTCWRRWRHPAWASHLPASGWPGRLSTASRCPVRSPRLPGRSPAYASDPFCADRRARRASRLRAASGWPGRPSRLWSASRDGWRSRWLGAASG
jgi:translation initiation factor IF-2